MSKQVSDREKSTRMVVAAAEQHATVIGEAVSGALSPYLRRGEEMPDVALLVRLVGRGLDARTATLVAADAAHVGELADDAEPRARRDAAEAALRKRIIHLRGLVEGAYGDLGLRTLSLWEPAPIGPDQLKSYVQVVVAQLGRRDLALPAAEADGAVTFSPSRYAALLAPLLEALVTALDDVAREEKEGDTTQITKNQAMAANDRDFARLGSLVEELARVAGLDGVADRIRPSRRSPGVVADPTEPSPDRPPAGPATDVEPAR